MKTTLHTQGIVLNKGDQFQVGEDSATYTFKGVVKSNHGNFDQMVITSDYNSNPYCGFRIDNMEAQGLYITKL